MSPRNRFPGKMSGDQRGGLDIAGYFCCSTTMIDKTVQLIQGQTAREIVESIELAVRDGLLPPGGRLPTIRHLARDLRVSPATVAAGYQSLAMRGVVVSHGRRGTRVSHRPMHKTRCGAQAPVGVRDLSDGNPDRTLLPPLGDVLREIDSSHSLYGEPTTHAGLVEVVRQDFDDCGVGGTELCVIHGAMDAIERLLTEHLRPGDRVAVEDPGFGSLFALIMSRGLSLVPVEGDEDGVLPSALEAACRDGVKAVVVTPRAQTPTGASFTQDRATDLKKVLDRHPDLLVIEDDHANLVSSVPLYTLHHGRRRWAYVRSFAKAINPDLRLAVMTGDEDTLAGVHYRMIVGCRWVSHILQRVAHAILSDSCARKCLTHAAQTYVERREALREALCAHDIGIVGRSGFNVWIPVDEETPVVQALAATGWAVAAGERFRINTPPGIRITTSTLEPREAVKLAGDIAAVMPRPVRRCAV